MNDKSFRIGVILINIIEENIKFNKKLENIELFITIGGVSGI